jgi:hypothetical protein
LGTVKAHPAAIWLVKFRKQKREKGLIYCNVSSAGKRSFWLDWEGETRSQTLHLGKKTP